MKILMIHNEYSALSGEEVQFNNIATLIKQNGHEVILYQKNSSAIQGNLRLKFNAFFSGIYSIDARREVSELIERNKPSLAFVQNLFPQISPAILPVIKKAGVPIVMRVANYRLMCPNGLFYTKGDVCERCLGGREYWCILKNCEEDILKSTAYAVRSAVSRIAGWYKENVDTYICASEFLKSKLISDGIDPAKIHIVPNYVPQVLPAGVSHCKGTYVGLVGRISREKGVEVLLKAAIMCPEIAFKIAGRWNPNSGLSKRLPDNVEYVGYLNKDELESFYTGCRILVSASNCYETFGISVAEAMTRGIPVVVSRLGVFPELIEDNKTGILFIPGNAEDLASKINVLWNDDILCKEIGKEAQDTAYSRYAEDVYSKNIESVLSHTVNLANIGGN